MSRRSAHLALLAPLALAAGACDGDDDGSDRFVSEQAAATLGSGQDLALVSHVFAGDSGLTAFDVESARVQAIVDALDAIDRLLPLAGDCVTVETDGRTYVELVFDRCEGQGGLLTLDGTLRGELDFDTAPCGSDQCPTRIRFTVSTPGLTVGDPERTSELRGAVTLARTLAEAAPQTLSAELEIVSDEATLSVSAGASWQVQGICVTFDADAAAEVTGEGPDVGLIAIHASDVHRCLAACPDRGRVLLSYGSGDVLRWDYSGDRTVQVVGPGVEVDLELPCRDRL